MNHKLLYLLLLLVVPNNASSAGVEAIIIYPMYLLFFIITMISLIFTIDKFKANFKTYFVFPLLAINIYYAPESIDLLLKHVVWPLANTAYRP